MTLLAWNPSPNTRNAFPTRSRSGASGNPSKQAVVGQVSTVCPRRSIRRWGRLSLSIVKSNTLTPGRPSNVSPSESSRSIPASHLQPITDVAKPVIVVPAWRAQRAFLPVMTTRAARIVNASANVSAIVTPSICTSHTPRAGIVLERDAGVLVEVALEIPQDRDVVLGVRGQTAARRCPAEVPFLDHQRARLEHVARRGVDRHIRIRPGSQMTFRGETEQPRGSGTSDDGNLVQRILASEAVGERAALQQLGVHAFELLIPVGAIHQQPDQRGI